MANLGCPKHLPNTPRSNNVAIGTSIGICIMRCTRTADAKLIQCRYRMLFICDGYGRYDLADLLSVIKRLWTSHSMSPVEQIDNIHITVNNSTDGMRHLDQWILNLTEPQFCNERIPHQRSYGTSQMI